MGLLYILGSTCWIAILYGGSAYSAVGFLGNLWWHPEQTLMLLCNRVRVNGLKRDGKTGDVCFDNRCTGRRAHWPGVFPCDCSAERVEIWLGSMPDDCVGRKEAWLCIIPEDCVIIWLDITTSYEVEWMLGGTESWFCSVVAVPEYFRRAGLSFHKHSLDCAQIFCSLALFCLETPFLRAFSCSLNS